MVTNHEQYAALGKAVGFPDLYFKREDQHPYGSHKGRSIPVMMDYYAESGDTQFAISSSGNAALAAAKHLKKIQSGTTADSALKQSLKLDIFIGNNAAKNKSEALKKLADDNIRVLVKERPLQALTQATQEGARSLRQSVDDIALLGYKELAEELSLIQNLGAIFIGTSSGTTAQALAQYFSSSPVPRQARPEHTRPDVETVPAKPKQAVQVHIVQTSSCHPMSDAFETYDGPDETSKADAIVDKTAHRKDALVPLIKKTGGNGWFATNENISAAQDLVKKHTGLSISANGALSVAGVMQAAYQGWEIDGAVVCLITGE